MSSKSSESFWVFRDIDLSLLLEIVHAVIDELVIEILTTEMGVTVGGLNLEDTFIKREKGDIESTTTEIENEDVFNTFGLSIKTVGNGSSGWLIDDSKDIESRDRSSILGGLSLSIVEISWDSDDGR